MSSSFLFASMEPVNRAEPCSLCGNAEGRRAARVEFWNLQTSDVVQCARCRHIQLDPKLSDAATATGCFAYYKRESAGVPAREQSRNRLRNFRRGVLFGLSLKKHRSTISTVLEFGPGDGFFLQGLRFVYPEIEITVLDIVEDVLASCRKVHGYGTVLGCPDSVTLPTEKTFDLVVARDVIEHVNDVPQMLQNIKKLLKPKGLFHFLTPNGYEDIWGHAVLWQTEKRNSELLINHVNYFEGSCLETYLNAQGLRTVSFYTYKFKDFFRGKGRKLTTRWSRPASGVRAEDFTNTSTAGLSSADSSEPSMNEIYKTWYVSKRFPWLTYLVCVYHHLDVIRLSPHKNIGHEIFGLFEKA